MRQTLLWQFGIARSFAADFVIGHIDRDAALWEPVVGMCTVHEGSDGWWADWPDEEHGDEAPASIAWVLWHLEWWLTDTLAMVNGTPAVPHDRHRWSGGTAHLDELLDAWGEVLRDDDLDRLVEWVLPGPVPLAHVAAWVTFELTKNLAEVNQLMMLRAAVVAPASPGHPVD